MSNTLTVRLTDEQHAWLKEHSRVTGIPMGQFVRDSIDRLREKGKESSWLDLAGSVKGLPPDLSSRKGFSRS